MFYSVAFHASRVVSFLFVGVKHYILHKLVKSGCDHDQANTNHYALYLKVSLQFDGVILLVTKLASDTVYVVHSNVKMTIISSSYRYVKKTKTKIVLQIATLNSQ